MLPQYISLAEYIAILNFGNISKDAEMQLNNLPRKNLNFLTANEVWDINQNVALEA